MRVLIEKIKVKPGRRAASPSQIAELSKSIAEVGLLNPITIDQNQTLIAGLHRLEAVKQLGWNEVECSISSLEGLQAELAEIDENFVRNDLSAVAYGELLLRRKEIYETLHPETKSGTAQAAAMNRALGKHVNGDSPLTSKPFTADTADKLGVSRTTIERQVRIAKHLTPEAKELLRHSDLSKEAALKLSRFAPEQQVKAAALLASGKIKSVEEYQAVRTEQRELHPKLPAQKLPADFSPHSKTADKTPEPPFTLGEKQFATVRESAADLKNPDKDCSCTPDSFLAEITEFARKFHTELEWFRIPYYQDIFSKLSQAQYDYFCEQMGGIHSAVNQLSDHVKKGRRYL